MHLYLQAVSPPHLWQLILKKKEKQRRVIKLRNINILKLC
jgi:hypothetical protein